MRARSRWGWAALASLGWLAGCDGGSGSPEGADDAAPGGADARVRPAEDAGGEGRLDARVRPDATSEPDAGGPATDATPRADAAAPDARPPVDALAPPVDAAAPDAAAPVDAASPPLDSVVPDATPPGDGAAPADGAALDAALDAVMADAADSAEPTPDAAAPCPTGPDEACNDADDDCDGRIDEDFADLGQPCLSGVGACERPGRVVCSADGLATTCDAVAGAPSPETCNGADDDCDGQIDDDLVAQETRCGVGPCAAVGRAECEGGELRDRCVPGRAAADDTTCDAVDEDCDGRTDEDFVPTETACGVGVCAGAGRTSCAGGRVLDDCREAASPTDEVCNGADDDCDGEVDEDLGATPCGLGPCAHDQLNCVNGRAVACDPLEGAADEVCNALDDDCDGDADDGLAFEDYFPDPDGDGFHGPVPADVQPSCGAWLAIGETADGVYTIDPDGPDGDAPSLEVYCDMTGGGWTRVFYHDVAAGYWAGDADSLERSAGDPLAPRYSILSRLEAFRSSDGRFDLRLDWPGTGIPGANVWRQSSNPTTDPIAGYVAVEVDYTDNGWGGLENNRFNEASFIDGTVGAPNWYYAVGTTAAWGNPPGVPAYAPPATRVALWVRPDDEIATVDGVPVQACGPFAGHASDGGDCSPDDPRAHPEAEEVCDGIDNDCDRAADEGHVYRDWYPDRDGDGRGASSGSSCASLRAGGAVDDGVYTIRPGGRDGPSLRVYCDMTRDGGGWTRVFHHDIAGGYFASDADARSRNEDAPESALYSILGHLESFRSSDGRFVLRIDWPQTPIEGRNIWSQASLPTTAPVAGYEALDVDFTSQFWGGLELSDRAETYLDGSVGHANWFYSVGSQVGWSNPPGIPAHTPRADRVALWVRPDDAEAGGTPIYDCVRPAGFVDVAGDCDDTDDEVHPGAEERCNGEDDDCDGEVDEGCPFGDATLSAMPQPLHFYPREVATDQCTFVVEGDAVGAAREVRVTVTQDGLPFAEASSEDAAFAIPVTIDAGLTLYDVSVAWSDGGGFWRPVATVEDVVCGDVFLIDGQSNAVAIDYHGENLGDAERNTFVRSYGSAVQSGQVVDDRNFSVAVAVAGYTRGSIGQWGLRLANAVKDAEQVPILVINGAVGGTRVDQHQRNDANPVDPGTIYGRMLWRARQAGVADAVRAIFWHQGESDGAQAYATHLGLWRAMYDDWLADYPNVEGVFPFQVRAGCGNPTWNRNIHRELPGLLPRVLGHMSTTGVAGHDGCHFFHRTYAEWGERMARVVRRDLYGHEVEGNIDAPDPVAARWRSPTELEIDYGATGGGLVLQAGAEARFSLSDNARILGARVAGRTVVLTTAAPSAATWVSFVDVAGDIPWLVNDLGIGGFAYYQFPITPPAR